MQYDLGKVTVRKRRRLPHWDVEHGIYFVTWNLADALPPNVRQAIQEEIDVRVEWQSRLSPMSGCVEADFRKRLLWQLANRELDRGIGSCVLRRHDAAAIAAGAVRFFEGTRYCLYCWCVMPNHVHVIFSPLGGQTLPGILKSWKGYASREINKLLDRSGQLWQEEYFDRTIRDSDHLNRSIAYVLANPAKAELVNWPFVASYPEAIARAI